MPSNDIEFHLKAVEKAAAEINKVTRSLKGLEEQTARTTKASHAQGMVLQQFKDKAGRTVAVTNQQAAALSNLGIKTRQVATFTNQQAAALESLGIHTASAAVVTKDQAKVLAGLGIETQQVANITKKQAAALGILDGQAEKATSSLKAQGTVLAGFEGDLRQTVAITDKQAAALSGLGVQTQRIATFTKDQVAALGAMGIQTGQVASVTQAQAKSLANLGIQTQQVVVGTQAQTAALAALTPQVAQTSLVTGKATVAQNRFSQALGDTLAITRGMFVRIAALAAAFTVATLATQGIIGAAIDFENSFSGVRKTVDASEQSLDRLAKGTRKLATEIPVSVHELNKIGEIAGQLGIRGVGNILKFEEVIAKVAVTTNITAEQAATDFAKIAGVMQEPVANVDRMAASVVDLGNRFESTEVEILNFSKRIAGAASVVGLATHEVFAISNAVVSSGINVERGGTAVQKVLLAIHEAVIKSSDELEVFARVTQMTGEQFANLFRADPAEAFLRFVEGLNAAGEDAIRVLSAIELEDQRLIGTFLSLSQSGDKLRRSLDVGNKSWLANAALVEEYNKKADTTSAKAQLMRNNFNEVGITLGTALLPALVKLSEIGIHVAQGFLFVAEHAELIGVILLGLSAIITGPVGIISALLLLAFQWRDIFGQLPAPVQDFAISVAKIIDDLVNGIIAGLDTAIFAFQKFLNSLLDNKVTGFINFGLKELGLPSLPDSISLSPIDLESNIAGTLLSEQTSRRWKAIFGDAMQELEDSLTQGETFNVEDLDLDDFLDSLEDTGDKAKKAKEAVDILSDGIITLSEALQFGLGVSEAATLEMRHETIEFANRAFRAAVELEKASRRIGDATFEHGQAILQTAEAEVEAAQKVLELRIRMIQLGMVIRSTTRSTAEAMRSLQLKQVELAEEVLDLRTRMIQLNMTMRSVSYNVSRAMVLLFRLGVEYAELQQEQRQQLIALGFILRDQRLRLFTDLFRRSITQLGEEFRRADETVTQFLHRLANAALEATRQQFEDLFRRPSREEAALNLQLALLRRERARLLIGGATEEELQSLISPLDRQIEAIEEAIDLRQAEFDVMRAQADLADRTLLTDRQIVAAGAALISTINIQSALVQALNTKIFFENILRDQAAASLNRLAQAANNAAGRLGAGRPASNLAGFGSLSINVQSPSERQIVQTVSEALSRALREAGMGGVTVGSGSFVPG